MWSRLHPERRFIDLKDIAYIGAVDMRNAYVIMSDNLKYFGANLAKALECLQSLELTTSDTDGNPCLIVNIVKNNLSLISNFIISSCPKISTQYRFRQRNDFTTLITQVHVAHSWLRFVVVY